MPDVLMATVHCCVQRSHVSRHNTSYYDHVSDLSVLECILALHDASPGPHR